MAFNLIKNEGNVYDAEIKGIDATVAGFHLETIPPQGEVILQPFNNHTIQAFWLGITTDLTFKFLTSVDGINFDDWPYNAVGDVEFTTPPGPQGTNQFVMSLYPFTTLGVEIVIPSGAGTLNIRTVNVK